MQEIERWCVGGVEIAKERERESERERASEEQASERERARERERERARQIERDPGQAKGLACVCMQACVLVRAGTGM